MLSHSPLIITDGLILCLDAANKDSYPGTGNSWNDLVNNNTGTFVNGPSLDYNNSGTIWFDGMNDYTNSRFSPLFLYNDSFSVSWWMKTSASSGRAFGSVSNVYNPGNAFITGGIGDDAGTLKKAYFKIRSDNDEVVYPTETILDMNDNMWHHYVGIRDKSSNLIRLYVDGVQVATKTDVSSSGFTFTGYPFYIGAINGRGTAQGYFSGNISNVLVYSKALSRQEVFQNYQAMRGRFIKTVPNIVTDSLYINLDAGNRSSYSETGTVIYDLAGNFNSNLINGPTFNTGNRGYISFDGVDDYIQSQQLIAGYGANPRSLCVLVYPTELTTDQSYSAARIGSTGTGQLFEILLQNNSIVGHFWGGGYAFAVNADKTLLNNYSYVVMSYSGTYVSIYVDGVLKGSSNFTLNSTYSYLYCGLKAYGLHANFKGRQCMAHLYNKMLSDAEVQQNFNAIRGRFGI